MAKPISELTDRQKLALAGRLSPAEFHAEGMGLVHAGMATFDPLTPDDEPRAFKLTKAGRVAAHVLRRTN